MHERSSKAAPIDVILYEIEMFRHCAKSLPAKQSVAMDSTVKTAEYYLGIEGFLLHLRNLLAFFMSRCGKQSDLGINSKTFWRGHEADQRRYSDLMKLTREINERYRTENGDLHEQISRFLQHCTIFRYTEVRAWDIEHIFADFDQVLAEFEKRFRAQLENG